MPKWDAYLDEDEHEDSFERIKSNKPKQSQNKVTRKDNRRELRKHKTKQQENWEDQSSQFFYCHFSIYMI